MAGIEIQKIKIGIDKADLKTFDKMFSSWNPINNLGYFKTPNRTMDGTLQNETSDAKYYPEVKFILNYLTAQDWSEIIQKLNRKLFVVEYYDIDILQTVIRSMYLKQNERERLLAYGGKLKGVIKPTFTMVSRYGYDGYKRPLGDQSTTTYYLNETDARIV